MTIMLLCISHVLAFLLGGVTSAVLVVRGGGHLMGKDSTMSIRERFQKIPPSMMVLFICAGYVLGLGIQQWLYQREADRHDACVDQWGSDTQQALDARVVANKRLDRAQQERADATAAVLRTVVLLRKHPPQADETALDATLRAAERADNHVQRVAAKVTKTRANHPYPPLRCD